MNKKTLLLGTLSILAVVSGISYGLIKGRGRAGTTTSVHSIMLPRTVSELSSESYATVVGTVADTKVVREKSSVRPGETDIVTIATINVEKYLTNPHKLDATTIQVKTLGGTIGNDSMVADDYPAFVPDTKVVVFLNRTDDGEYTVYGTAQGKFTVNQDGTLGTEKEKPFLRGVLNKEAATLTELESDVTSSSK